MDINNTNNNNTENKETPETTAQPQTSYAVRPEHRRHRRLEYADKSNMLVVRNWLNIGFMLFAVVGVILWTQMDDRTIAIILLLICFIRKIAEVSIRLFKK